jgi:hypothetical protein
MLGDPIQSTIIQSQRPPLESLEEVKDHVAALRKLIEWTEVGILYDDGPSAILVVLLRDDAAVGVTRFCLTVADSVAAVQAYQQGIGPIWLACWQGHTISSSQLVSLDEITDIWRRTKDQSQPLSPEDVKTYFDRIEKQTKEKGRSKTFSRDTQTQVWFDAHGRCMFEGCGKDLTTDPTTGHRGNFAYLAHNVASSESGPRGVLFLSAQLANEPKNILLLCDTHHRLVDTVAKVDYPADRLSEMRRRFCETATELLNGLEKPPIPAYCVSWPVHRQVISTPSALQIAQALVPIGARLDGRLNMLSDNETTLRTMEPEALWELMPHVIESTADRILMQVQDKGYRAALFAIGLMPPLIALGAKLGNKCEITPMLRHRENGLWYWPSSEPQDDFFAVEGLSQLSGNETEVIVRLALTAEPKAMDLTTARLGLSSVAIRANEGCIGNGALAHPVDGYRFRQRMQELMHLLKDQHGVQLIHLLPCASNAACVFFGQAFDSYHPDLLVYDFASGGDDMVPRLLVRNEGNCCIVDSVNSQ